MPTSADVAYQSPTLAETAAPSSRAELHGLRPAAVGWTLAGVLLVPHVLGHDSFWFRRTVSAAVLAAILLAAALAWKRRAHARPVLTVLAVSVEVFRLSLNALLFGWSPFVEQLVVVAAAMAYLAWLWRRPLIRAGAKAQAAERPGRRWSRMLRDIAAGLFALVWVAEVCMPPPLPADLFTSLPHAIRLNGGVVRTISANIEDELHRGEVKTR